MIKIVVESARSGIKDVIIGGVIAYLIIYSYGKAWEHITKAKDNKKEIEKENK